MYRQLPNRVGVVAIFGGSRYLVPFSRGIATTSVRTGLAMTGNLETVRQTPISLPVDGACGAFVNSAAGLWGSGF